MVRLFRAKCNALDRELQMDVISEQVGAWGLGHLALGCVGGLCTMGDRTLNLSDGGWPAQHGSALEVCVCATPYVCVCMGVWTGILSR